MHLIDDDEPLRGPRAVIGSASLTRSAGSSRSKWLTEVSLISCHARVVLPHWLGPVKMTTRLRASAFFSIASNRARATIGGYHTMKIEH